MSTRPRSAKQGPANGRGPRYGEVEGRAESAQMDAICRHRLPVPPVRGVHMDLDLRNMSTWRIQWMVGLLHGRLGPDIYSDIRCNARNVASAGHSELVSFDTYIRVGFHLELGYNRLRNDISGPFYEL